jgi:hypothetical protein
LNRPFRPLLPPRRTRAALAAALLASALASGPPAQAGALPEEGACPIIAGASAGDMEDAAGVPLREGTAIEIGDLPLLQRLLPPEIWRYRGAFFYEGMLLEIGPCFRRYPAGAWYEAATTAHAGKARLDDEGNLREHEAGLPFPIETIADDDPNAGLKWAWNFELRYRGAGPIGRFRLVDLPDRIGSPETYIGTFFQVTTSNRADLGDSDYRVPEAKNQLWAAGGRFEEPFNARHLAWRQLRSRDALTDYSEPDDTFVYVPTMRKSRRAATAWVDGLYTPRYRVAGDAGGGPVPFGSDAYGPSGSIQPTAALSIAATENLRRGFVGLAIRPNAYEWQLVEERPVLAPLNAKVPGWPESPERNFGPSGLSVATDTWDVRHAVVIEGRARKIVDDVGYVRMWIDAQTAQPLYVMTERPNRLALDVGQLVHRWSGEDARYPEWADGKKANVFDPVAAVFFDIASGRAGWRRESYDVRSVPVDDSEIRSMIGVEALDRRGR